MSQTNSSLSTIIIPLSFLLLPFLISGSHVINFRFPSLYPESVTYDSVSQHFVVGSLNHRTLVSISDAGVTDTLITDEELPVNVSIVGVTIDRPNRRLLATIHSLSPLLPPFSAVAAYSLRSPRSRLFLASLPESTIANDVAVDYDGNAYVTDSAGNVIWKITPDGVAAVFSRSPAFTSHLIEQNKPYTSCGLNGIIFNSKGYLLVVQSNTGKLYKVDIKDGYARTVILNKDLTAADDIAVRRDGVVIVVSQYKVYFIKSADSWAEGVVFDETALDSSRFATSVAVGADDRVYVLYGHVDEGVLGNLQRENFSLLEIGSEKESKEDAVWVYVLIGFGLAYFCFWRFQMKHLYTNMNKKIA